MPSALNLSCDWVVLIKLLILLSVEKCCSNDAVETSIIRISEVSL